MLTDQEREEWDIIVAWQRKHPGRYGDPIAPNVILAVADALAAAEQGWQTQTELTSQAQDRWQQASARAEQAEADRDEARAELESEKWVAGIPDLVRDRDEARAIVAAVVESGETERLKAALDETANALESCAGAYRDRGGDADVFWPFVDQARTALAGEAPEGQG